MPPNEDSITALARALRNAREEYEDKLKDLGSKIEALQNPVPKKKDDDGDGEGGGILDSIFG